jgi:TPR repeat protein
MRSINSDPAAARGWYEKAARLGSAEAQARLSQLQN